MKKVNAICHRMRDINLIMNVLSGDKDTGNYQSFSHEISCIRKTVKNIYCLSYISVVYHEIIIDVEFNLMYEIL